MPIVENLQNLFANQHLLSETSALQTVTKTKNNLIQHFIPLKEKTTILLWQQPLTKGANTIITKRNNWGYMKNCSKLSSKILTVIDSDLSHRCASILFWEHSRKARLYSALRLSSPSDHTRETHTHPLSIKKKLVLSQVKEVRFKISLPF